MWARSWQGTVQVSLVWCQAGFVLVVNSTGVFFVSGQEGAEGLVPTSLAGRCRQ